MEVKVMTYNIHHGKGMDRKVDINRIADVIAQSNVDIVGLNEVDKHFSRRSNHMDQISVLAEKLNMYEAFSGSLTLKSKQSTRLRQYGNAILSRFPILTKKTYQFDFVPGILEGRSFLQTSIQVNSKAVYFNVTHLSLNPFLHRMQTKFIMNQLTENPSSIIMGDFNMRPGSEGWRKITRKGQDVWHFAGNGKGHTYPSLQPRFRLDYIFTSNNVIVTEAKVVTTHPNASDHLPLVACLRL
ncbi:endonuclease/exonuclease/phosphatase family protein [Bacillus sp. FJAT-44742]|uniref:endonuclease/exonuclease/phosphatase family protein n=1 Tax=Bacillus sp. FJAT-44742 TaxID=2014005 RepID=UPI000C236A19|nr:endonuclease/exonuclease/phosphatase family protein [Bacillus sp. FJAT-44742]